MTRADPTLTPPCPGAILTRSMALGQCLVFTKSTQELIEILSLPFNHRIQTAPSRLIALYPRASVTIYPCTAQGNHVRSKHLPAETPAAGGGGGGGGRGDQYPDQSCYYVRAPSGRPRSSPPALVACFLPECVWAVAAAAVAAVGGQLSGGNPERLLHSSHPPDQLTCVRGGGESADTCRPHREGTGGGGER